MEFRHRIIMESVTVLIIIARSLSKIAVWEALLNKALWTDLPPNSHHRDRGR